MPGGPVIIIIDPEDPNVIERSTEDVILGAASDPPVHRFSNRQDAIAFLAGDEATDDRA